MENNYLVSIAIPLYNGEEFLRETLDSITSQINTDEVELVLCDDKSSDATVEIVKNYTEKYKYVKFFQNEENLGMDGNFEKVAGLGKGRFIWFSGQDDYFREGAVAKVLEVIKNHEDVNFIHMNFSRNSHNFDRIIREKMVEIEEDAVYEDRIKYVELVAMDKFPSFLPSFIMKRDVWNKVVNKKDFYNTCFVQLGIFFEALKDLKIYIIAEPYIKGRVPDNKWQADNHKLLDILSGDFEVITYAYKNLGVIPDWIYKNHYKNVRKWFFNTIILAKSDKQEISERIKKRFEKLLNKGDFLITTILCKIPYYFYKYDLLKKFFRLIR